MSCSTRCTITADTTSSAEPWPNETIQKARVRIASRAVNSRGSRSGSAPAVPSVSRAGSGGRPSTV